MIKLNLFIDNIYLNWTVDKEKFEDVTQKLFAYYMNQPEIAEKCCLNNYQYESVAFDFLLCNSKKTHEINKEYRRKDYPADIITFAVFADSTEEEKFVLDLEINLGEIIIALDKVTDEAEKKDISKETELYFLISHGILHLLGFDHQTEDEFNFIIKHQKNALESIGIVYDKV
ncbi:rRNA maturation RNase YbeY [bacterium]|nr:rRNA maturation RNase YbeY [bacterium]